MRVPLTIADFLERAALVYPDRIGVVDEPDQPAESWGELTYGRVNELAPGPGRAALRARERAGSGPGRGARRPRDRPGRAGRRGVPQRRPAARVVLRGGRLGPGAGPGELPALDRRGALHRRALGRLGAAGRPRA